MKNARKADVGLCLFLLVDAFSRDGKDLLIEEDFS
jgi:hypothetical protein